MNSIAIIDYGMGNLHSVASAVEHVAPSAQVIVSADSQVIREADRVILPGVGAIRDCIGEIRRLGFDELVKEVAQDRPLLGICVGMQAMMQRSEENNGVPCIGLFDGDVKFFGNPLFEGSQRLKVPHMGWNGVSQTMAHPLWHNIEDGERFYFVHSYYVPAEPDMATVAGQSDYGYSLAAAIAHQNIFATQFHPEKSQHSGLQLLENFSTWDGRI
mgnify:CR=1 FL=1